MALLSREDRVFGTQQSRVEDPSKSEFELRRCVSTRGQPLSALSSGDLALAPISRHASHGWIASVCTVRLNPGCDSAREINPVRPSVMYRMTPV